MNDIFVKSLYESIVKENLQLYKDLYETTDASIVSWTQPS
jgi:succinate dehydrogenase flavin-adding protein (antitoxin of CptAB toxin-antitoxin module)